MATERIGFVFLTMVFGLYVIVTDDIGTRMDVKWLMKNPNLSQSDSIPNEAFDLCVLRVYDPFYGKMKKVVGYSNPVIYDPLKDCNKNFRPPTELINGKVRIYPQRAKEFDSCAASCLEYVTPKKTKNGEWKNFTKSESVKMECDFIWTKCFKKNVEVAQGAHMQLYEKDGEKGEEEVGKDEKSATTSQDASITPDARSSTDRADTTTKTTTITTTTARATTPPPPPPKSKEQLRKPNVYIIVVDSVSSTQALRHLPKTIDFLKRNMSGVFFHHLNKVGENSRPNGYAMTMGWRIGAMDRSAVGAPNLEAQQNWSTVCYQHRDNDSVIFKDYQRAGFKTLYAEDYKPGTVFSWGCNGFVKQPATHSNRPYLVITAREKMLYTTYNTDNCYELSRDTMKFTGLFMKAYKDKPKFGLSWLSTISHDNANMLPHEDDYFEKFFKEHEPHLRDSFVFFMADHGMRFGGTYYTELGKREIKNPFLLVTVPEFLRKNDKFMTVLDENSMKLLTQFDVHATLVDLLKVAPKSNFNNFNFTTIFEDNPNNATSILRPLGPFSRRSCRNIPVPFQYCLCEHELVEINNPELAKSAHEFLVDYINQIMTDQNVTSLCYHLKPLQMVSFQAFVPEYPNRLYEIVFTTTPGRGLFKAHIQYDEPNDTFKIKGEIDRVNSYGTSARCLNHIPLLKPWCYCSR